MSTTPAHALPVDYKLQNYRITDILGQGGFGITYLAWDEVLEQKVAIKEYYPGGLTGRDQTTQGVHPHSADAAEMFQWGLDRFLSEARILAKLSHPNICRVLFFTSLNNTGYMVMAYEEGEPLDKWAARFPGARMPQDDIIAILDPITQALGVVHELGIAHRDVKPGNIFIRSNGEPVLLDFGAARDIVGGASQTMAAIVSVGYSPLEQYSGVSQQGPWTDIYATGAVAYRLITGRTPPDAPGRLTAMQEDGNDSCEKLVTLRPNGFDPAFLAGIDRALQLRAGDRPQSIAEWRGDLGFDEVATVVTVPDSETEVATVIFEPGPAGSPAHATGAGLAGAPTVAAERPSAPATEGKRKSWIVEGVLGTAAIVAGGWLAYQQLIPVETDRFGNTEEKAVGLGRLTATAREVTDTIGKGDPRDVVAFSVGDASIVDVVMAELPRGAKIGITDEAGLARRPLRNGDRLSYRLASGKHFLSVSSKAVDSATYRLDLSAKQARLHEDGGSGSAGPIDIGAGDAPTEQKGVLWERGDEAKFSLRVAGRSKLAIGMRPASAEATVTLIDANGLSLGRIGVGGEDQLNPIVEQGNYELVATSRQQDPFRFALSIDRSEPPKPKTVPVEDTKTVAEMTVAEGTARDKAEVAARQQARAMLVLGNDYQASAGQSDIAALEKGIPFDERWSVRWPEATMVRAELEASVRQVELAGAMTGSLSTTEIEALLPFDLTLTGEGTSDLNVGVFAWGADDSVVRVFPIGATTAPWRLRRGDTGRLSDRVERLVSAPLPGESESREAILAVGCAEAAEFAALAPAAGEDVSASLAKATDFAGFLDRLAGFCPSGLSVVVLPYTVRTKS